MTHTILCSTSNTQYCVILIIHNTVLKTDSQPLFYSGNDAAGVVVEVGSGVSTFKPGD